VLCGTCELDGHFMHTFHRRSVDALCPLHFYQTFGRRAVDALPSGSVWQTIYAHVLQALYRCFEKASIKPRTPIVALELY